jgi:hypothetical protein
VSWNAITLAVKHGVATAIVVGGVVAFTAASYFALLAWAVLMNEPLGGPLAFPFMVLFALLTSVGSAVFVFFPTTAVTEWACVRCRVHLLLQIPIAAIVLIGYVFTAAIAIALVRGSSVATTLRPAAVVSAVLLVPLGAYWWSLQSVEWLIHLGARALRFALAKNTADASGGQ